MWREGLGQEDSVTYTIGVGALIGLGGHHGQIRLQRRDVHEPRHNRVYTSKVIWNWVPWGYLPQLGGGLQLANR